MTAQASAGTRANSGALGAALLIVAGLVTILGLFLPLLSGSDGASVSGAEIIERVVRGDDVGNLFIAISPFLVAAAGFVMVVAGAYVLLTSNLGPGPSVTAFIGTVMVALALIIGPVNVWVDADELVTTGLALGTGGATPGIGVLVLILGGALSLGAGVVLRRTWLEQVDEVIPDDSLAGVELTGFERLRRYLTVLAIPVVLIVMVVTVEFLKDEDVPKFIQVTVAVLLGAVGVWALFWALDRSVSLLPRDTAARLRPFVFVGPAVFLLAFFLVYPALNTAWISLFDASGDEFVGLDNYARVLSEEQYLIGIRNSIGWVLIVPALSVIIGLAYATLADKLRPRVEATAKSLIFLPMAISFVGASVVWTFVYAFRPEGFGDQIGLLNGIIVALGGSPIDWLSQEPWNNFFLMFILIWLQVGFSMVILSSAIKSVPDEILEASRIDGATEWQAFRRITVPMVASTIVVVWTTVAITTWKVFDIVFVTTGGRDGTQVIAQQMVQEFFTFFNDGVGASLAVILFIAVIPILVVNIRRFQQQEQMR